VLKTQICVTRPQCVNRDGPGRSVGIATGYGLDGPGIESRWGRNFPHLSRQALGPTQPPVKCVPGVSRGKKRPRSDADPSPPSSAVCHERVELYLYSPYGPYGLYRASVTVQGCTLPFFLPRRWQMFCILKPVILFFCDSLNRYNFNAQIGDAMQKKNHLQHTCFVLKLVDRYTRRYTDILVNCNWVDTRWQ
jgi:hypothetical protein